MPNEHLLANSVCLPNGFVKNCLASTHGECEQTNHHIVTVLNKHPLTFAQLLTSEGMLPNANEGIRHRSFAFAVPSTFIPILDKQMHSFAIRSVYVYAAWDESMSHNFAFSKIFSLSELV